MDWYIYLIICFSLTVGCVTGFITGYDSRDRKAKETEQWLLYKMKRLQK